MFALVLVTAASTVYALGPELGVATRLYQEEKFNDALATLDRYEQSSKPTARSTDLRGCILMELGKFDEADRAFASAHQLDANLFAPRLHSGDLLLRQKKFEDARTIYQTVLKETNILPASERLRFALLLTWLGEQKDDRATKALDAVRFPTETPAYFYAQAAWSFAHGKERDGRDWMKQAEKLYPPEAVSWFARWLFDFGWLKDKPPLAPLP